MSWLSGRVVYKVLTPPIIMSLFLAESRSLVTVSLPSHQSGEEKYFQFREGRLSIINMHTLNVLLLVLSMLFLPFLELAIHFNRIITF